MKKKVFSLLMIFTVLNSLFAVEPAVVISIAMPAGIDFSDFESQSTYAVSNIDLSNNELFMLTIPQRVIDSKLMLASAFSWNPVSVTGFAWDVFSIYNAKDSFIFDSGKGSLNLSRSIDYKKGTINIAIEYDKIEMNYLDGSKKKNLSIRGDADVEIELFVDSVATIKFETGNIFISDSQSASNSDVEIVFSLKEDGLAKYTKTQEWSEKREETITALKKLEFIEWKELGLSMSSSAADFIRFVTSHNVLDAIDCFTVFLIEKENGTQNLLEAFSNIIDPVMYIDGKLTKDIKLSKAVSVAEMIMGFIT